MTAPRTSPPRRRYRRTGTTSPKPALDRLSNSVAALVKEGRIDEADAACEQLRTRYPEVCDWLMRKAMICEARGEARRAIEYCERTIAWMDAHPEDFDPESRTPFYQDIERLRGSLRNAH